MRFEQNAENLFSQKSNSWITSQCEYCMTRHIIRKLCDSKQNTNFEGREVVRDHVRRENSTAPQPKIERSKRGERCAGLARGESGEQKDDRVGARGGARKARRHLNGISACCSSVCAPQPHSQREMKSVAGLAVSGSGTRPHPHSKEQMPPSRVRAPAAFAGGGCNGSLAATQSRGAVPVRRIHSSQQLLWILITHTARR